MLAAFAAVYIVWGSTYLAIRYAVETIPPFIMVGTRFIVSGRVALRVGAHARRADRPTAAQWRDATIAGILMLCLGNGAVSGPSSAFHQGSPRCSSRWFRSGW